MNKYNAVRTTVNGVACDSKAEARRYAELLLLEKAGVITELKVHPRYEILPGYERGGAYVRAAYYVADFEYYEGANVVAEDVKGGQATITALYRLKRKMFEYHHPHIEFRVINS